ncbi:MULTISPECIES: hypothetical protein [Bacillota]|uniref:hypothetical protein n=1 Tax=Bacillota TaxID=1239 RepID=UPI00105918ED|nr:hypothetical protein [Eisenbergiella tayi]MBS6811477.1 hypothetical protein [Lachnospiraceae bacterium]MDT4533616.1 hypothetical protein [Eisenbergiella tayi]
MMKMEGNYPDEVILQAIQKYEIEVERQRPLDYQIKIRNKTVVLADREIYPNITMRLPKFFAVKKGEEIESGYLIRNHPEMIFTSACGTVNFTFDTIMVANILQIRKELIDLMGQRYPQNTIYEQGIERELCWFDYKSFAADADVYNMMFLFPYQEKTVIGSFKCAFCDYMQWKYYVLKMLETIEEKN